MQEMVGLRRVGILGGTFDPVHAGHIAMARQAIRELELSEVLLLPTARPSYRTPEADYESRMAMCRLAAEGEEGIRVSDLAAASNMQYAAETAASLHRRMPDAQLTFLLGADKLTTLPYWRNAERLFALCDFLCFPRSGIDAEAAAAKARGMGARIRVSSFHCPVFSAAAIRAQTANYEDAEGLPLLVLCYIAERGLYQKDELPKLRGMMNPHRFEHTLGVRREAVRLAARYHLPVQKAARAGLLHDCAKGMPLPVMRRIAVENRLVQEEEILSSGALLHGPVGAYLARTQFGVQDEAILDAIRNHTVGRPGMTPLELAIFVADATEEGREDYEGLSEIRQLSDISLEAAALKSLRCTEEYLTGMGRGVFPLSRVVMRDLEKRIVPEIMARYF